MISLPIKHIKDILNQVFNESGYTHQDINIKLPKDLDIKIDYKGNTFVLSFTGKLPLISWKRLIVLSARIQGLELNEKGGRVKIKYFPDINFVYDEENKSQAEPLDFSDIEEDIKAQYPDEERQKIASLCLQYASEWATIGYSSGLTKDDFRKNSRRLKRDCYSFVKESVIREKECGSVIISFILIYVILPIILKWIIEKIFRRLVD